MSEWWALEMYSESDWRMWGIVKREDVADIEWTLILYNQDEYKRNTCTLYASMSAWSYTTGIEIPLEKRKEIVDKAIVLWLDTSIWRRVNKAVKLIADEMWLVSYVSVPMWSDDYWEGVKKWYRMIWWYGGNATYNKDRDNNNRVELNKRGKQSYAHCIWLQDNLDHKVVDNYNKRPSNIYEFPNLQAKIKESWQMFYNTYFYVSKIIIPMDNLPKHDTNFSTPLRLEVLKSWKAELSVHINNGWKPTYDVYTFDNPTDETDIIGKMQTELAFLRNWLSK